MAILITGMNGFVGSALCKRLLREGAFVRGAVRSRRPNPDMAEEVEIVELSSQTDWVAALKGVDQVVHLAARTHVIKEKSSDPWAEFRRVNVDGSAALARQAADLGVKRFIFLSSIKVNGEFTEPGRPFFADDAPAPEGPYGVSKYEAEQLLRVIAADSGMELVIIRSPLVYGPGVKANFNSMMRWLARGFPLPLAALTENRRSLLGLDNLVDLIMTCLTHYAAANRTFLVSDNEDLSTAELFKRMGDALGYPARLFAISPNFLKFGAELARKPHLYQRLCGSLQLDTNETSEVLGWTAPVSVEEGLRCAAEGFLR